MVNIWSIFQLSVSIVTDSQSTLDDHRLHHSLCGVSVSPSHFFALFFRRERVHTTGSCTPTKHLHNGDPNTVRLNCRCNCYPFCHLSLHCYVPVFSRTWSSSWWARWFCFCNSIFQRANQAASYSCLEYHFNPVSMWGMLWQKRNLYQSLWDIPDSHRVLHFIACGSISGCPWHHGVCLTREILHHILKFLVYESSLLSQFCRIPCVSLFE